jgi:hypothetical protein
MSKFLKVMIVLLTIAAMAAPAIAEDRLSLGGQMRVWGWSLDNGTNTSTFMAQRLRTAGKISIAEGVSITFRSDITEATWGARGTAPLSASAYGSGRMPYANGSMQWDRAHIDLTKGSVHFRAGQQWAGFGLGTTINSEDTGLAFDVKGPVTVSGFWFLSDQGTGGTSTADSYVYAVKAAHKTDSYSGDIFLGGQTKALNDRENAYILGVDFTTNLNAVKLAAELDFFFGDAAAATATAAKQDVMGTQLFVDASMAASDMLTVGGQLYYALAAGNNEVQYQYLGNDYNGHDPIGDLGGNMYNEVMSYGRPFDFTGDNAGVMGVRIYGLMKANDALKLGAGFAYLTPEDDKMTTRDSDMVIGLNAQYALMANTSLEAQVQFIAKDDTDTTVEDETQIGVGLFVSF